MVQCPDIPAGPSRLAIQVAEAVAKAMASLPSHCSRVWIALSGGCDSVSLLHATHAACSALSSRGANQYTPVLHAVHVNHGLQAAATDFEHECHVLCASLSVPLHVRHVEVAGIEKSSCAGNVEARARDARYAAFAEVLEEGDVLWMAHHADDQAETVLQRALRGSGLAGMSGMPQARTLGTGHLERPLLALGRAALEAYACHHGLRWCNDPSNVSRRHDRNYLRHDVVPLLKARWPNVLDAFAQVAQHAREAEGLLDRMADRYLACWTGAPHRLPIGALIEMGDDEVRLVIRRAVSLVGLPTMPRARLKALMKQLPSGRGRVEWLGAEVRLWQGELYLMALSVDKEAGVPEHCRLRSPNGAVIEPALRERQGGERLHVRGHRRTVKALFQSHAVPPWQREGCRVAWWQGEAVALLSADATIVADGWHMVS